MSIIYGPAITFLKPKKEYGVYISITKNWNCTLKKIKSSGATMWELPFPSVQTRAPSPASKSILAMTLDPNSGIAYVIFYEPLVGAKVYKISSETGEAIAVSNAFYDGEFTQNWSIVVTKDGTKLVASYSGIGNASDPGISYWIIDASTLQISAGMAGRTYGSGKNYALPDGRVFGLAQDTSDSSRYIRALQYIPSVKFIGSISSTDRYRTWVLNSNGRFWLFPSTGTEYNRYQVAGVDGGRTGLGALPKPCFVFDVCFLKNGDMLLATNVGLSFNTVNSFTFLLTQYKTIAENMSISAVGQSPDGTIYFVEQSSNAVYRINNDDTYTQIGTTSKNGDTSSFLCVGPGSNITFPELFQ